MKKREKSRRAQTGKFNSSRLTCVRTAFPNIVSPQARQAGFTIVEVLVAVVVFSIGLIAIAGMQTRSIEQSTFSDQMSMRITAITRRAEALKRFPVLDETLGLDGGININVTTSNIFEEENMCEYGKPCDWSYVDYEDKNPHKVRQRIVQDYPLPNLVMIQLEAEPERVDTATAKRRTVRVAYVRSTRWN